MDQLMLFFLCNFSSFFNYVGGSLVTNRFSLLLIDSYILAIQQFITHEEQFVIYFLICNNRKWPKQTQSYFY